MEIAWRTVQNRGGLVEYRVPGNNNVMRVWEAGITKKHHVTLSELQVGTRYEYSVYSSDQAVLEEGTFETAPEHYEGACPLNCVSGIIVRWGLCPRRV